MKHELKLYQFAWDCGRDGLIEGLFISTPAEIKQLIGAYVDFGCLLGKHTHICGLIEAEDLKEVSVSLATIIELKEALGNTISGINPFEFLEMEG